MLRDGTGGPRIQCQAQVLEPGVRNKALDRFTQFPELWSVRLVPILRTVWILSRFWTLRLVWTLLLAVVIPWTSRRSPLVAQDEPGEEGVALNAVEDAP
jgi:hypothetical protein